MTDLQNAAGGSEGLKDGNPPQSDDGKGAGGSDNVTLNPRDDGNTDFSFIPGDGGDEPKVDPKDLLQIKRGDETFEFNLADPEHKKKAIELMSKGNDYQKKTEELAAERKKVEADLKLADAIRRANAGSADAQIEAWDLLGVPKEQQQAFLEASSSRGKNNMSDDNKEGVAGGDKGKKTDPVPATMSEEDKKRIEEVERQAAENDQRYWEMADQHLQEEIGKALRSDKDFASLVGDGSDEISSGRRQYLFQAAYDAAVAEAKREKDRGTRYGLESNPLLAKAGAKAALEAAKRLGLGAPDPLGRATDTSGRGNEKPPKPPKRPGPNATFDEVKQYGMQAIANAVESERRAEKS